MSKYHCHNQIPEGSRYHAPVRSLDKLTRENVIDLLWAMALTVAGSCLIAAVLL